MRRPLILPWSGDAPMIAIDLGEKLSLRKLSSAQASM
jgi:hypothetical protein